MEPSGLEDFLAAPYPNARKAPSYRALVERQGGSLTFDQLLDLIIVKEVEIERSDLDYIVSRYDAGIRSADTQVGRLLDRLDELGLAEKTLVVLTADHGDELYDHNYYFFHASSVYQGVVRIPLILRWPGRLPRGVVVDRVVENVDILPTVLGTLALPALPDVEGASLLPLMGRAGSYDKQYAFVELFHKDVPRERGLVPPFDGIYGVRDARWKLVVNASRLDPRTAPYKAFEGTGFHIAAEAIFDLEADPREQRNLLTQPDSGLPADASAALAEADSRVAAGRARQRLSAELDSWLSRHRDATSAGAQIEVSQAVREHLEDLGYVEDKPRRAPEPAVDSSTLEGLLGPVLRLAARADLSAAEQVRAWMLEAEARVLLGQRVEARRALRRALDAGSTGERAEIETRARDLGLDL